MFNVYRFIKSSTMIAILASIAWFGANSMVKAQEADLNPPVEGMQGQPKLLSEMTEEEKAQLTKEERASLEELEKKLEEMKEQTPKY